MEQPILKQPLKWAWRHRFEGAIAAIFIFTLAVIFSPGAQSAPVKDYNHPIVVAAAETEVTENDTALNRADEEQIRCMARNAYFEAGNQPRRGKIAVSNVVMNRVRDRRFPSSPCAVVQQQARGVCQFSWVCNGSKQIRSQATFNEAKAIAQEVYLRNIGDVTGGAQFFHANYVRPSWARTFTRTTTIGDHIFYRG